MSGKGDGEIPVAQMASSATPQFVTVVAPSTLAAGYTFTAQVDGKDFTVTVPQSGVTEGEAFQVPYPVGGAVAIQSSAGGGGVQMDELGAPRGRWRGGLCECFSVLCNGLFWQGWCCNPFLLGQLAQRMNLTVCGSPGGNSTNTCSTISGVFAVYLALWCIGLSAFLWPFMLAYMIILAMNVRHNYRKKYDIPPSCCGCCDGMMDDFCCAFCFECCVGIQMARHTHDERQYPYQCCSETGLTSNAPAIV
jgi:Cys-rich protein (TIGR01571 family)